MPFVPYVRKHFNDAHAEMKVLIVGKATDGWGWSAEGWDKTATLRDVNVTNPSWFEDLARLNS